MKKNENPRPILKRGLLKMIRIMRLTIFIVLVSLSQVFAVSSYSQQTNHVSDDLSSQQQKLTVTGKVVDTSKAPLPGVTVVVKNSTSGVITDIQGNYSLPNVSANATLVFSFVGLKSQEISVEGKPVINVTMEEEAIGIDEVVAIGYGTQKKKDVTSAIAIVDAKTMRQAPVANVTSALQGLTPGVEVQSNQGRPGEAPTVRVRGVSSTNNTDPLYVIDGVPQSGAYVNASDIESMQVLKDAASSAIYGSRGANGVIIITTKTGKTGAPKVSYNGYYGFEQAWKQIDLLNIQQWADLVVENNTAGGTTPPPLALDIVNNRSTGNYKLYDGTNTDWQKEVFQTGMLHENNVDISGGTANGNYFFSANEYKQDGMIIYTPYKRYSVRMNSNWQSEKFKFGENMSYIYSQNRVETGNGGRSEIEELIKITPNIPVYNSALLGGYSGYDGTLVGHDASNPVGSMARVQNWNYNKRFMANAYGEYQLTKDLQFRSTFGVTSTEFQNSNLTLKTDMYPKNYANTTLSESSSWAYNWVWENQATFHKVMGDHDLTVMGAYTSEYYKYHGFGASGTTIQTEVNDVLSLTEGGYSVNGSENENSRTSYLGRVMYNYKGKYMLTANIRRDGSSKFGPGNKWGNFPSASLAWRMSDEGFMKSLSSISNLKLRTSYGVVGNDAPVGAYSYISGLSSGQNYVFNDNKVVGVSVTGYSNPSLTWETVKQFDAGVDIGLFDGKIEATVDYFDKRTVDMLIGVPLPASSGSSGTINKNLGSILNRGLEFSTTYRKKFGELDFSVTGNLTTLHNEVLDLKGAPAISAGSVEFANNVTLTTVGRSIGEFYGFKMLGVFKDQAAVDAYTFNGTKIQPNAKPGDIQFADLNPDGKIDGKDRYFMGSPIPKITYGLNINMAYKGFDFSMFWQGVEGNKIFSELVVWTEGMHNNFNCGTAVLNRWKKEGDVTNIPRAVRNDPNGNIMKASDRYIKDGSYLRLKNVTLGYTLPKSVVNNLKVSNIRLYVTSRNLLTFTKYPFYDPEIGSGAIGTGGSANTSRGIDNGYYPQPRTVITGIQLDF